MKMKNQNTFGESDFVQSDTTHFRAASISISSYNQEKIIFLVNNWIINTVTYSHKNVNIWVGLQTEQTDR